MMQKDSGQSRNYYLRAGRHTLIGNWIEQITDFFFPWGTYCVCCGNFIDRQRSYCICDHCMQKIGWGRIEVPVDGVKQTKKENDRNTIPMFDEDFPLDSIRCCMKYGLYERRFIVALKYNGYTCLLYTSRCV